MNILTSLHGEYNFARYKKGILVYETGFFPNLITDTGLDMLGGVAAGVTTPSDWHVYMQLGSGNTPPAVTDSALSEWRVGLAEPSVFTSSIDTTNNWLVGTKVWTFPEGTASGVIKEVGIGAAAQGALFSRALIKDLDRLDTTFVVLPDEELVVTYRLYLKQTQVDVVGVVNGESAVTRIKNASTVLGTGWGWSLPSIFKVPQLDNINGGYTGGLGATTSIPTGTFIPVLGANVTNDPYIIGTFRRTASLNFPATTAFTLKTISWSFGPTSWQCALQTPVTKSADHGLTFYLSITWGRTLLPFAEEY